MPPHTNPHLARVDLAGAEPTQPGDDAGSGNAFFSVLALLLAVYAIWLLTFWPGVLGHDSFAILRQVEQPEAYTSGKPAFWYFFVAAFYRAAKLIELPVGAQFALAAVVFARLLSWQWRTPMRAVFWISLLLVCMAPHVVFYLGSLYPDGIFSVAATGLLFELWLAARRRRISGPALVMIALTLPVALFARSNGLVFLLPIAAVLVRVDGTGRRWLAAITLAWCGLVTVGARLHHDASQGVWFPLAVFETVNFLRAGSADTGTEPSNLSARTVYVLVRHRPLDNYVAHHRPDYWDALVHNPAGPRVGYLSAADQSIIVQEFLRHNLWHNLPAFLASRVNVFVAAATARAGIIEFRWAKPVIENLQSRSVFRPWQLTRAEHVLTSLHDFSLRHRLLLWSPLPAIALLLWLLIVGIRSQDFANLLVTLPMTLQSGAIFVFSTAGEYRYLLPFYVLPMLLLPLLVVAHKPAASS